jgi:Xaa-Pro aminopeptidase
MVHDFLRSNLVNEEIDAQSLKAYWLRDPPAIYHLTTVRSAHNVFMCFVFI